MQFSIKELGKIITGNTPSKTKEEYWNSSDIYFVKPDRISDEGITLINDSNEYISEKARAKARVVPKDSIFVTCIGTIGKIGITSEGQYAFNQQINVIIPNDIVLPKYLAYSLLYSKSRLVAIANAPVVPIINKSQFGDFLVNIEVDKRKQEEMIEKLDKLSGIIERRKSELKELDNLIKARFVEMFSNESNMMKMSDVCSIITDGTHQPPKFVTKGIPFIFVSNVVSDKLTYDAEKCITQETYDELIKRTPIEIGDVLLSTVGSYGHPAVVKADKKFLFQRHIAYLKPRKEIIDSNYLHGALLSPGAQRQIEEGVKGIAQKTLNLSEIKKMVIPVPNLVRQKQFADFTEQIDKSKVAVQKALDEAQTLFDSLMQEYFG